MNRWYRQVLPERSHVIVFASMMIILDSVSGWTWLAWGQWLIEAQVTGIVRIMLNASQAMCGLAAVFLAIKRIIQFPPGNTSYREWLATTPWSSHQRLPFGPWQPVIQDAIPLGILGLFSTMHGVFAFSLPPDQNASLSASAFTSEWWGLMLGAFLLPVLAFCCSWAVCGFVCVTARWKRSSYIFLMVSGVLIHLGVRIGAVETTAIAVACVVIGFVFVYAKMQRMVRDLPQVMNKPQFVCVEGKIAPAFEMLSPRCYRNQVIAFLEDTRSRASEFGVLLFIWLTLPPWELEIVVIVFGLVCVLSLVRVAFFADRTASHLGVLARWHSRRFFVPEYDRIWLPSLAMVLVSSVPALLAVTNLLSPQLAGPLAVVAPVLVGWMCGPDYQQWSLTAPVEYSLKAGRNMQNKSAEVTAGNQMGKY